MLRVFDVPVQTNDLYASDLFGLQNAACKSPVTVLSDQVAVESNSFSGIIAITRGVGSIPLINWVLFGLMLIGLAVVAKFVGRLVGWIFE